MNRKEKYFIFTALIAVILLCGLFILLPPVTERLAWHISQWRVRIQYAFNPPEEAVFVPEEQVTVLATTVSIPESTPFDGKTQQSTNLPQATVQPTSLPNKVELKGVRYEHQHEKWNYCAPANLAMALSFWGWQGNRDDTGSYLKPNEQDKNVMPYEMADYVMEKTSFNVILRHGGTLTLLKTLLAGGFPVVIETGVFIRESTTGRESWMGHYSVLTGYDDVAGEFITQDSYYQADYLIPYQQIMQEWRAFNYQFLVVYPPEKKANLETILGSYVSDENSYRIAYEKANNEITRLTGNELFFAWFNRGTSMRYLNDYWGAASSYDEAFRVYADLPVETRPWRMLWYQTGPYFAYYYTGRFQDVVNLADQTLNIPQPDLEESYYWRAMAKQQLGNIKGAIEDLRASLKIHPGFAPSVDLLHSMGESE